MIKITNLNFQNQTIENIELDCETVDNLEIQRTETKIIYCNRQRWQHYHTRNKKERCF
jgi:hypothetical protein